MKLKAPFPYFGGKSRAAHIVWDRLGDVANYCEPFAGSLAVLLARPTAPKIETVNDADAMLSNFWRALKHAPEAVAEHASWPVNETDLHARHLWLVGQRERITEKLVADPEWYDAKAAGWWVWGISCWIGGGWCEEVAKKLPHLGDTGRGINRRLPHLGDAGQGIFDYLSLLSERLRRVRVCCGDWSRILGPSVTFKHGVTGVFLDPPYAFSERSQVYAVERDISADVRAWAIENGDNPLMRICLAGYEGEHTFPDEWECVKWKPRGGFDGQNRDKDNKNRERERLWFSPHCLHPLSLFAEAV